MSMNFHIRCGGGNPNAVTEERGGVTKIMRNSGVFYSVGRARGRLEAMHEWTAPKQFQDAGQEKTLSL
ncbi:hypothetical protein BLAT2472_30178 [Burkholderia latens]